MSEIVYKIVLNDALGYRTLFKAIEGKRRLTLNKWLKANNIFSIDGRGQKPYLTGIHCFKSEETALKYLDRFRTNADRVVIKCKGRGLRQKPTNKDVFLADEIFISSKNDIRRRK
jgi:hypothetical protein